MTILLDDSERPGLGRGADRSPLGLGLNLVGVVVVAFWLVVDGARLDSPAWVYVVAGVALAAWAVRELVTTSRVMLVSGCVMVVAGAVAVQPTQSLLIVTTIVGIVVLGTDRRLPIWMGAVAAVVAAVVIAAGSAVAGESVDFVFGTYAGLLLGVLLGVSRRQYGEAEARRREVADEQQRADLAADRARAARDVHDVLAHSLGGLVLQLDAVEALLEVGRVDEAASRAADARHLAADGLAEARRAVSVLRDPAESRGAPADATRPSPSEARTDPDPVGGGLADLVAAHRSFGGHVVVVGTTALADLDDAHRPAVIAVVREALSNARRHAPGSEVALSVARDRDGLRVTVANPLLDRGHGLVGMRERIGELGDGSTVDAHEADGRFVVAVHFPARTDPVVATPDRAGA